MEGYAIDPEDIGENGKILTDQKVSDYYQGYRELTDTGVVQVDVTDANAHAWVEIYDQHKGWYVVDITPASDQEEADVSLWNAFMRLFRNRSNGTAQSNTGGTGATGTADAVEAVKRTGKVSLGVLALLLLIFVITLAVRQVIRILRCSIAYHRADTNDRLIADYQRYVRKIGHKYPAFQKQTNYETQIARKEFEMKALQAQINPHFLYNTLESITWMVEANRNTDAVFMISELAKLLRISLSKGRTVIRIADEIQHSTSYMNIQKVRYKERFATEFIIDEEINDYCTVKLIVQPILENAIYYGVGNMDEDDGGKITVRGEKKGNDIYISVEDNGMGMSEDVVRNILVDNNKVPKHGSGVGVINVHSRIKLMFGSEYGLKVYSEPDEGTKVVIHIPAIPYTEENRERLERQDFGRGMVTDEEE